MSGIRIPLSIGTERPITVSVPEGFSTAAEFRAAAGGDRDMAYIVEVNGKRVTGFDELPLSVRHDQNVARGWSVFDASKIPEGVE